MPLGNIGDAVIAIRPQLIPGFDNVITQQLQGVVNRVSGALDAIGGELTRKLTLPIAVGMTANLAQFSSLDAKLQETATLFSAVGDRAERFTSEFRDGVSEIADVAGIFERDIAPALYQAISAGIPKNNVFEFLEVAGRAAIGGVTDIETTVNGITTAVNAFASQSLTANEASDILFRGVARGKTTFQELSQEIATAAPLAAAAGIQFSEFVAIISTMALSGTTTSEAVTQVRAAINGLLRPGEEMTAIFKEAGYETAGLAVQQVGLQAALAVVVAATQGETGELIKLLGGAEAANGALQITGDNAERFNSIFRDTASATGATNAAFQTMSKTASQTFKNLFVQIDRVGSSLGEVAFTVIGPLTKALTGVFRVVNDVVDAIANGPDVIKGMVSGFITLLAAIGPVMIIGSRFLALFGVNMAVQLTKSGRLLPALASGLKLVGGGMSIMIGRTLSLIPSLGKLGQGFQTLGRRGIAPMASALGNASGMFGLVTIAITAAAVGLEMYLDHVRRTTRESQFATEGAERLADSLGLVVKPAEALQAIGEIDMKFRLDNLGAIASLEEIAEDAGALENRLILIAWELVRLGNTPDEAISAVQKLASEANIDVPLRITTEDISFEAVRTAVLAEVTRIQEKIPTLGIGVDPFNTEVFGDFFLEFDERVLHTRGEIEQLGKQAAGIFTDVGIDEGIGLLRDMERAFEGNTNIVNTFSDAFLNALMKANPELELTTFGVTTVSDVVSELYENVVLTDDQLANLATTAEGLVGPMAAAAQAFTAEQHQEQVQKIIDAQQRLGEVVAEVQRGIMARLGEIENELAGQIPFWGEYSGAAELSVTDVLESLDLFNAHLVAWNELSKSLIGEIPEGLRAELDAMPLDQRAGLAKLAEDAPAEFDKLIAAYEESFGLTRDVAKDMWTIELPELIAQGNAAIAAEAAKLEEEFGIIGTNVATVWRTNFERVAATWADTVRYYAGLAVSAFPGMDFNLPGVGDPTPGRYPQIPVVPGGYEPLPRPYEPQGLGPPSQQGGANTYNYEYHYNYNITTPPGSSPSRETERVLGVARTDQLIHKARVN